MEEQSKGITVKIEYQKIIINGNNMSGIKR